jgi:dienelactone hydrolase
MKKDFTYTTKLGNAIQLSLYGTEEFGTQPCIIYLHGFKGFKDWAFVPYVAAYFASKGYHFLTFNFSHNGIGENPLEFTEMEKFAQNTHSLEVNEAKEIIQLCTNTQFFGDYLDTKLGIIGHSRGGGVAILAACGNQNVSAVNTWASVSTYDRYDKSVRNKWKSQGFTEVKNARTGQIFQLGLGMLNDIEKNSRASLNILEAVGKLSQPLLITHGDKDESVGYHEAEQLNLYANASNTEYYLLPETNHVFDVVHPFVGTTPALEKVLARSFAFFEQNLR